MGSRQNRMAPVLLRIIGVRQADQRAFLAQIVTLAVLLPSAVSARAQEESTTSLRQEQRVTAVDVFLELEAGDSKQESKTRTLPKNLKAEDFEVRVGGQAVPVVAFADPRLGAGSVAANLELAAQDEPWTIVLYFDLELAERNTVRWAAAELAERVKKLVALGEVELVVAEHGETRALAPTRDGELLEGELAGMMLDPHGVHEIVELRAEALEAIRTGGGVDSQGEGAEAVSDADEERRTGLGNALVEQEVSAVERHLDQLLIHLTEREILGAKRALFWISDGFDVKPATFYRSQGLEMDSSVGSLTERSIDLAATLASYGWVTFSVSPPAAGPGLVPGFRIGKWLYRARMPAFKGIGGTLVREKRRDPDIARSYQAIGESELSSEDPEEAQKSFETALYHFAGDPRTRKEQATAKAGLGRALEAQGEAVEARQAFRHAVELDPDLASLYPQVNPRLLAPRDLQELLARNTAGRVIVDSEGLAEAVSSLSRRARLTFQVEGPRQGVAQSLDVVIEDSDLKLRHARWARSGTPPAVAAARVRRLAEGELVEGELEVRVDFGSSPEEPNGFWIALNRDSYLGSERWEGGIRVRVTVATGRPGSGVRVRHRDLEVFSKAGDGADGRLRVPIEKLEDEEWIAALVEVIESGRWGAVLLD